MKSLESTLSNSCIAPWYWRLKLCVVAVLLAGVALPRHAGAQDAKRAEATRAELQASLAELEQYIASSGYSSRLRSDKRREADLIKVRLEEGDLQVGDQVDLAVSGEAGMTGMFPVLSGRVLSLPGLPDIPLKGVLRSEGRDYLSAQIGKYIKDPQVRVRTMISLTITGSVGKPGFYPVYADTKATDAFMLAGGISGGADPNKAFVRRGSEEIWPKEVFREAMRKGLTLDELNLRAGDELILDPKKQGGGFNPLTFIYALSAVTSVYFLVARIFP